MAKVPGIGPIVSKVVKAATRAATKAIKKEEPRIAPKMAAARPKVVAPSVKPSVVTPSTPVVRSTAPTRSPFVSAAVPETRLIVPSAAPAVRPSLIVPAASRTARSAETQAAMQAERIAAEEALAASRAAQAQARTFGQPTRNLAPEPAPTTGFSNRYMNLTDRELAAQNLADNRIVNMAEQAAPAATFVAPRVAEAAPAAVETAVEAAAKTTRKVPTRAILEAAGITAPQALQAVAGQDQEVPGWLQTAANVAQIAAGGSLARRGFGKNSLLNADTRAAFRNASALGKAKTLATKAALPVFGAYQVKSGAKDMFTGGAKAPTAPAAEALAPTTQEPVLPPLGGGADTTTDAGLSAEQETRNAIEAAISNLETGNGTKEDADTVAAGQTSVLEQAVTDAMAGLEAAYGGAAGIDSALAAGDPILAQQLAGIDADYQAGMMQIQANYAGALGQVAGYQAQADALMRDVAAQQMAGFEAAAGGLEGMVPSTGVAADQAAAAGVSNTALGGAGITGAALARGLAGAASAQAAADRLRVGTDLQGQLATGRLTQADLASGLARAAAGEKAAARAESAKRDAEARAAERAQKRADAQRLAELKYQAALDKQASADKKAQAEEDRKQRIAELKMNAELDLAMKIAGMTAEERAAYKGSTAGSKKFTVPSWYGKADTRDASTPVKVAGYTGGQITVGEVQNMTDLLDSYMQDPRATNPSTSFSYWADKYAALDPDALAILRSTKRPASASAMYKSLFGGATPTK